MHYEILFRFSMALLWGGLVGIEREYRSKSAGFRTMMMISLGACLFTMMSEWIGDKSNPDRIASNIVTGIGFLGAGVIFRSENRITGITTAATIWAVAAVGMGIGGGNYFAATVAGISILVVLILLPYVERIVDKMNQFKTYTIECSFEPGIIQHFESTFKKYELRYRLVSESKEGKDLKLSWETQGHLKNHNKFLEAIITDEAVLRFEY
ncbi:MAG TPA: MgtC/SapB family protein [Chitinophagaceae bacterium]|nr:MgtC/SapB family protein [Chitinophagaceae bacterium]